MPMTSIVHPTPNKPLETASNIYVPVTNPVVIPHTKTYRLIDQPNIQLPYPDIQLDSHSLAIQPRINQQPRLHRSIGWPQYVIMDLFGSKHTIIPSMKLNTVTPSMNISVDYAFNAAMSFNGCSSWLYRHPKKSCSLQDIIHGNRIYQAYQKKQAQLSQHTQKENKSALLIPGLLKQINLFQNDLNHKRLKINNHTLYIIMIGGNDINHSYIELKSAQWKKMKDGLTIITQTSIANTRNAIEDIIQNPIDAQHIIIVNLFNLGLVPEAYHKKSLYWLYQLVSTYYNIQQHHMIQQLHLKYPQLDIRLFDANRLTNQLAKSNYFKTTLGQSCDSQPGYYTPAANPANCYLMQNGESHKSVRKAYLFWNRYHFSSVYYQAFAYTLAHFASNQPSSSIIMVHHNN